MQRDESKRDHKKDESGHGTAVAGVAISDFFGVARKATAIAVRVGRCSESYQEWVCCSSS